MRIAAAETLADLHQRVLRFARFGSGVVEVLGNLRVGELAPKPGSIPEKEGEQHQEERECRDQQVRALARVFGSCGRSQFNLFWHDAVTRAIIGSPLNVG